VAAEEEQGEGVVLAGSAVRARRWCGEGVAWRERGDLVLPGPARLLRAQGVGQAACGDLDQPTARVGRDTGPRPLLGRRQQGLLYGVLGEGEVAVTPYQRPEDLRRVAAQQVLGLR
jgi:hypothetical protein